MGTTTTDPTLSAKQSFPCVATTSSRTASLRPSETATEWTRSSWRPRCRPQSSRAATECASGRSGRKSRSKKCLTLKPTQNDDRSIEINNSSLNRNFRLF
uniref:(northern house mosquito) hypothetical protein n=1 Tax=Culex pipiens TaxID=7175 RepID=A0A8D8D4D3_CULPI